MKEEACKERNREHRLRFPGEKAEWEAEKKLARAEKQEPQWKKLKLSLGVTTREAETQDGCSGAG